MKFIKITIKWDHIRREEKWRRLIVCSTKGRIIHFKMSKAKMSKAFVFVITK